MALSTKVGTFTAPSSTGDFSVTGVGFQPKVVLFFATGGTATGDSAHLQFMVGAGVSATERWTGAYRSEDALATTNISALARDDSAIVLINSSAAVTYQADLVSMDADGFTVNFSVAAATGALISYLALGGSDISQVKADQFAASGSTGSQAITGVGFQPDSLLVWNPVNATTVDVAQNKSTGGVFGMATASAQGYTAHRLANASGAANSHRRQRTDKIVALPTDATGAGAVNAEASLTSLDSDGFTLNWSTGSGFAEVYFYLALKGAQFAVGSFLQPTSTGSQGITGFGFQPSAVIFSAQGTGVNSGGVVHARRTFGVATGASDQRAFFVGDTNAADPTVSKSYYDDTTAIALRAENNPTTASATAAVTSLDADGVTLDWTAADATAREVLYWAVGPAGATSPTRGQVSFLEFETPSMLPTRGQVSFAELEVPSLPVRGRLSFLAFEVPLVGATVTRRHRHFMGGRTGYIVRHDEEQ